jgi:hypothetical protein
VNAGLRPLVLLIKAYLYQHQWHDTPSGGVGSHMLYLMAMRTLLEDGGSARPPSELLAAFLRRYGASGGVSQHTLTDLASGAPSLVGEKAFRFEEIALGFSRSGAALARTGCLSALLPGWPEAGLLSGHEQLGALLGTRPATARNSGRGKQAAAIAEKQAEKASKKVAKKAKKAATKAALRAVKQAAAAAAHESGEVYTRQAAKMVAAAARVRQVAAAAAARKAVAREVRTRAAAAAHAHPASPEAALLSTPTAMEAEAKAAKKAAVKAANDVMFTPEFKAEMKAVVKATNAANAAMAAEAKAAANAANASKMIAEANEASGEAPSPQGWGSHGESGEVYTRQAVKMVAAAAAASKAAAAAAARKAAAREVRTRAAAAYAADAHAASPEAALLFTNAMMKMNRHQDAMEAKAARKAAVKAAHAANAAKAAANPTAQLNEWASKAGKMLAVWECVAVAGEGTNMPSFRASVFVRGGGADGTTVRRFDGAESSSKSGARSRAAARALSALQEEGRL